MNVSETTKHHRLIMVTFKKREDAYVLRVKRNGKEKVFRLPLTTPKREVEKKQAEINYRLAAGWNPAEEAVISPQESRYRLGSHIEAYIQSLSRKSESTRYFYRTPLKSMERYFTPDCDLSKLTQKDMDRWLDWTGVSDYTKQTYSIVAGQYLKFLDLTFYKTYVCSQRASDRLKYFTLEELEAVCAAELSSGRPEAQVYVDLWRVTFFLGFRISGIHDVRKTDIKDGYIRVIEKGNKGRTVPVIPAVQESIDRLMARPGVTLCDGITKRQMYKRLKKVIQEVLPENRWKLNYHSLRHGCATFWLDKGLPITDIATILGHESVVTTQVYAKVIPVSLAERMKALA